MFSHLAGLMKTIDARGSILGFLYGGLLLGLATLAAAADCPPPHPAAPPPVNDSPLTALPAEQQAGAIRFLTGGIGVDEARAMRAAAQNYALAITFVLLECQTAQFVAEVEVEIRTEAGTALLTTVTRGPYLFVDLPEGRYHLSARGQAGDSRERTFQVKKGKHTSLRLEWTGKS